MKVDTITLWLGEKFVIVEPESSANKLFRSRGYTEEQKIKQLSVIPPTVGSKRKRGRSKKVKTSGA